MSTNNQLMDFMNEQDNKNMLKHSKSSECSVLFDVLRQLRRDEKNIDNKILQIYCASFQLALLESQVDNSLPNIIFDEIQMEKKRI